ncbi:MAG: MFS transporter, partial [Chloroflexi bacterium]|nr:MFS transporter [Chloroflexota bacterium]
LGVGQNYLVGVAAHLLAMTCLLAFRSPPNPIPRSKESFVQTLKGGLQYASRTRHVRQLLVLSLITEIFGFSYQHMMPVMARDVLKVGATGFGYLSAMGGVGQLAAMLVLVSLGDFQKKGWLLLGCAFGFGLFILFFALSPWLLVSLVLVAVVAGMGSIYDSTMATVVQTTVSADMRGRVMGLLVATFGLNQVGGLGSGAIGTLLSVPIALAIGGGVVATSALRLVGMARQFNPSAQDKRETASPTS